MIGSLTESEQGILRRIQEQRSHLMLDNGRSDHLAQRMYVRMAECGLKTICRIKPWIPEWVVLPDEPVPEEWWQIGCGRAPRPRYILPSVLVVPLEFWDRYNRRYRSTSPSNLPNGAFWSGPIRVQDIGDEVPDRRFWRDAHMLTGVCALAQQPNPYHNPGSLRCWEGWHQKSGQAFLDPERAEVVVDCRGSNPGHNRAFVFALGKGGGDLEFCY